MTPDPRLPTIRDVARAAGVSPATAARALGGYGQVRAETRGRVEDAARALGYERNSLAGSMITRRTGTIGLVVADIENPFFARAARGVSDVARTAGFEVVLVNTDEDECREKSAIRILLERRVDGLIVAPAPGDRNDHLVALVDRGFPLVLLDRTSPGVHADAVVVDNTRAAWMAATYLLRLGHRRIGLIADATHQSSSLPAESAAETGEPATSEARVVGYLAALADFGIDRDERLLRLVPASLDAARQAALALLALRDPPTAILATDNLMTMGTLAAIRAANVTVPATVSLVGFDNLPWTRLVEPGLTVLAQPVYDLGAAAASRVLQRIAGWSEPPQIRSLATELIIRQSTGPPSVRAQGTGPG